MRARTITTPFCSAKSPFADDSGTPLSVRKAFESVSGEIPTARA
jgi:hypothetical protein